MEDFSKRGLQQNSEPLTCTSRLSVWIVPQCCRETARQSTDQKNQIWKGHHNSELETLKASKSFVVNCKIVCHLVNCFLFHGIKSKCSGTDNTRSENVTEDENAIPFTDSYDIATNSFKDMVDENMSSWTISEEEIKETEMSTK